MRIKKSCYVLSPIRTEAEVKNSFLQQGVVVKIERSILGTKKFRWVEVECDNGNRIGICDNFLALGGLKDIQSNN